MLNPALDPAALAAEFRRRGRIRMADALLPEAAEAPHACLSAEIPGRLSCYANRRPPAERPIKLTREQPGAMSPAQRQGLQAEVLCQAGDQFKCVYQSFDLLEGHRRGERPATSSRTTPTNLRSSGAASPTSSASPGTGPPTWAAC